MKKLIQETDFITDKCKDCEFSFRLEFMSTNVFYCSAKGSNKTENGFKKIKANDPACLTFKKRKPGEKIFTKWGYS